MGYGLRSSIVLPRHHPVAPPFFPCPVPRADCIAGKYFHNTGSRIRPFRELGFQDFLVLTRSLLAIGATTSPFYKFLEKFIRL